MKNRAVVALFVAFLLSLPALAQQPASSTPSDQSQAASSSNSGNSATGKAPLQYESRQGFWGKVNPFARKKYVQKQTQPIRDRVNELDELTAANSKMIKDVDWPRSGKASRWLLRRPPKPTSTRLTPATRPPRRRPLRPRPTLA